jgi:hypothetical protein
MDSKPGTHKILFSNGKFDYVNLPDDKEAVKYAKGMQKRTEFFPGDPGIKLYKLVGSKEIQIYPENK